MKKTTLLLIFILTISGINISAVPMSGSYNVGTLQTYTSLTKSGGFFADVNSRGLSGNVTVNITSDLTTENGANTLNAWTETGVGNYTITIKSSAATLRTISGNPSLPLIDFNACDRVIIDGRFAGAGQFLKFRNTNGLFPTFRFINGASNDTIRYCIIESNNDSTGSGTIQFSTTTAATGNSNNVINNCDIRDRSDAAGLPVNAIYSAGTTSSTAKYNTGNLISNNNIYNFYLSGKNCQGVSLGDGTTSWTISGNSFYQTSTRSPAAGTGWNCILISSSSNTGVIILNNFIGGTAASAGSTAWTINGASANFFYGIRFSAAGTSTASSVNGNTIANLDFTSTPSVNNGTQFAAILISSGLVNVGTTSANSIGNNTTTGSVKITLNGGATNTSIRGIDHRASGSVNNNKIGSITIAGSITGTVEFDAISHQSAPIAALTISNNIIGSASIASSIQNTTGGLDLIMNGINTNTFTVALTEDANTVANLSNASTGVDACVRGIIQNRAATAIMTITNNSVFELSTTSLDIGTKPSECAIIGIMDGSDPNPSGTMQSISGNLIHGLHSTGNDDIYIVGLSHTERLSKGVCDKNKIYDLTNTSSSSGPAIYGIDAYWGSWSFYNNVVDITNGAASLNSPVQTIHREKTPPAKVNYVNSDNSADGLCMITRKDFDIMQQNPVKNDKPVNNIQTDLATNGVLIEAIHDEAEIGGVYYYNTIYVGGTAASGTVNSYCYDRPLSLYPTPVLLNNNLFYNNRTGGTGVHYAVGNEIVPPGKNWQVGNYNVYITPNSSKVNSWGAGTTLNITAWRDSSLSDKQTWNTTTATITPANLFTSVSTGDLSIVTGNAAAWMVSGKGIALSTVANDFNGNARATTVSGGTTDIGAYEFSATPPSNPLATVDFAPGSGVTSTYTLYGRTVAVINWGTGGTSYPTSVNIRYYTGIKHPNAVTGNYGGSYYDITFTGALTGTTYDITWYFGDNETYTIATPSSNTRLAKYVSSWEVFSVAGTGVYQSDLNWANLTVKTRGIPSLSSFTLTDGAAPLPVSLLYFNASSTLRSVNLTWATAWEINNRGFDIERRTQISAATYSDWEKVGNVEGHGTTTQQQNYKYTDDKLVTGKYQYRLKQIDYNGNSAYYNLNTPDVIDIGKPAAFNLHQNYPNPSNPKTKIDYEIPFSAKVVVKVYDFLGQEVTTLVNENKDAGYYTADFDGTNLASGVYFYRINVQGADQNINKTMKMILVK